MVDQGLTGFGTLSFKQAYTLARSHKIQPIPDKVPIPRYLATGLTTYVQHAVDGEQSMSASCPPSWQSQVNGQQIHATASREARSSQTWLRSCTHTKLTRTPASLIIIRLARPLCGFLRAYEYLTSFDCAALSLATPSDNANLLLLDPWQRNAPAGQDTYQLDVESADRLVLRASSLLMHHVASLARGSVSAQ